MKPGQIARDEWTRLHRSGFGRFLRSLLAGIPWSEHAEEDVVLHLTLPPGGQTLRLHNANGRTRIVGADRSDIEVRARKKARAESAEAAKRLLETIRIVADEVGDALELEVEVPRKWNRRGYANLEVSVPRSLSLQVSASNGKVAIEGVRAAVRAHSSNGSVSIVDVIGDIEIGTSNAMVCCSCTRGRLIARSSNGKIELDKHCGSVDASTSNGLIRATLEEVSKGGIQLATSNGRIVLELPDEVDADVDIRVDNGVIRNDRLLCQCFRETPGQIRGRLGSGGPLIKLRTSNGVIALR
ncbi:MAG: hypothetical protein OEM05_10715 [Myxococcales bacterium]|nr:hypothetical protein [Myxococcales bacterium]MDH3405246.1 hypothetical protein [Acidobacteriota bacterium]